jgi:hypothetical protein
VTGSAPTSRFSRVPTHWPWQTGWKTLWDNVTGYYYPTAQPRAA